MTDAKARISRGNGPVIETAAGDPDIARDLEMSEARAFEDCFAFVGDDIAKAHGLESHGIGSAHAFVARAHPTSPLLNRCVGLGVAEPATEDMLDALSRLYGEACSSSVELVGAARPADLAERLAERGYVPFKPTAVYVNEFQVAPTATCDLRIERVGEPFADAFALLVCGIYGLGEPFPSMLRATFGRPGWLHWLAFDGDRPVGGGLLRIEGAIAWISWAATLPSHRGRGIHAALVAARVACAAEHGCRRVTGHAAVDSRNRPMTSLRNQLVIGCRVAYLRWTFLRRGTRG